MEKEFYRQQRQQAAGNMHWWEKRQGGSPLLDQCCCARGREAGKKSARRWLFSLAIQNQVNGMDQLVPSQRIAQNDSTWARDSPGRNFIENGTVDKKIRGFSHIGSIKDSMNRMSQWNSKLFCTGNYSIRRKQKKLERHRTGIDLSTFRDTTLRKNEKPL